MIVLIYAEDNAASAIQEQESAYFPYRNGHKSFFETVSYLKDIIQKKIKLHKKEKMQKQNDEKVRQISNNKYFCNK
jgi:hypothetical protein